MLGIALRSIQKGEFVCWGSDVASVTSGQQAASWSHWIKAFKLIGYQLTEHRFLGRLSLVAIPLKHPSKYNLCQKDTHGWFGSLFVKPGILDISIQSYLLELYDFTKKHIFSVEIADSYETEYMSVPVAADRYTLRRLEVSDA